MKLRNKKTGEIAIFGEGIVDLRQIGCENVAEMMEKGWEDYEEPKEVWFIAHDGSICSTRNDLFTKEWKKLGLSFETREEAEKAVEKLKALKRLKDKGFKFTGWYSSGDATDTIRIYAEFPDIELGPIAGRDLDLLFGGEE